MGQRRKEGEWPRQRTRHVWVQAGTQNGDAAGKQGRAAEAPAPGLLITWRRHGDDWWAWLIEVAEQSGRAPSVVQLWRHQRDVTPAPTAPKSPDPMRWHLGLYADESKGAKSPSRVRRSDRPVQVRHRHVWVQTAAHHQPPTPGLLIDWQRHHGAWWAWAITVVEPAGLPPSVVQHWYHQRDVTPAPTRPHSLAMRGPG